ncbi:MAG: PDDEXK nuclease domain-containing protein [Victivallales bacterium]
MSKIQNTKSNLVNHKEYIDLLTGIKARIQSARIAASRTVNKELIFLYWDIGRSIVERQKDEGWGKSVVEQLSKDIQKEFPGTTGYSVNNLWRMRQLYLEYASSEFLAQAVPEMKKVLSKVRHTQRPSSESITFLAQAVPELNDGDIAQLMRQLVAEIPWGHNVLVLQKTKAVQERLYYVMASACFGWSRSVLLNQIKAQAYERTMLEGKSHNFSAVMPVHLAEQAEEAMKSSYNLEFLGIKEPILEKELENRLISKLKDFILELGYGFCYIGNQYRITLKDKEYFIDLLFYHRFLKCLVAFDLKVTEFKPEYAGKMDFYLNLLNDKERATGDNPSIGIILCAEKDSLEVEYSLKSKKNPIGVAEYQLRKKLPAGMKGMLPSPQEFETIKKELGYE